MRHRIGRCSKSMLKAVCTYMALVCWDVVICWFTGPVFDP
jgi:hypothetical protein